MVLLAPTLAASQYLDRTEQWGRLPPETKDHAVDLIQKGLGTGQAGVGARRLMEDGQPRQPVGEVVSDGNRVHGIGHT